MKRSIIGMVSCGLAGLNLVGMPALIVLAVIGQHAGPDLALSAMIGPSAAAHFMPCHQTVTSGVGGPCLAGMSALTGLPLLGEYFRPGSGMPLMIALSCMGLLLSCMAGIVLGLVGLNRGGEEKTSPIVGVSVNGMLFLLAAVSVMAAPAIQ